MAHISLYRKYRPDNFEKVIGQDHIIKTLINQIKSDSVSHAYLFTGTRGTGKTSTAKIFAKAVNCLNPVNGSPCNKCEACNILSQASNMDVIEVDAASNNGVDEIRELREKVKFPPSFCKFKVYIIDEVHMLTTSAFNALLKTLEEPPKHAIFILATTEVQALPQTILSRCMRFDFRLVSQKELSDHLKNILTQNGSKFDDKAIELIAESGEGSVRDMLSVADMCLSYCDNNITYEKVLEVLGLSDPKVIYGLAENIFDNNIGLALDTINQLVTFGKNVSLISKELATAFRNIILAKNIKNPDIFDAMEDGQISKIKEMTEKYPMWKVLRCLEIMSSLESDLRYNTNPRIVFETAVLKCAELKTETNNNGLLLRIKELEKEIELLKKNDLN